MALAAFKYLALDAGGIVKRYRSRVWKELWWSVLMKESANAHASHTTNVTNQHKRIAEDMMRRYSGVSIRKLQR